MNCSGLPKLGIWQSEIMCASFRMNNCTLVSGVTIVTKPKSNTRIAYNGGAFPLLGKQRQAKLCICAGPSTIFFFNSHCAMIPQLLKGPCDNKLIILFSWLLFELWSAPNLVGEGKCQKLSCCNFISMGKHFFRTRVTHSS